MVSGPQGAERLEHRALVVTAGEHPCALPLQHVVETMRPLPVWPLAGMPPFVLGLSLVRGVPTPVVHLGALLGAGREPLGRFVTLRVGERRVALGVGSVTGFAVLDPAALVALPPLLADGAEASLTLGMRDTQLLLVLQTARLLPEPVWAALVEERS